MSVVCTQLRGTACSARSGRRSSSAWPCVCVCVWRLECRSVIHYRLSRRAAGVGVRCSAVQSLVLPCVWPCPRHAISRYGQLQRSAVTLITSATVAVASLDRASPCACMRVYVRTPILYNTVTDCVPPCAPCQQCYCGGCTGVCLSACLSAVTAASARRTGRLYAHVRGAADL